MTADHACAYLPDVPLTAEQWQLVRDNLALACWWARRRCHNVTDYDERETVAVNGLILAAQRYDPERGVRFTTYATYWLRRALQGSRDPVRRACKVVACTERLLREQGRLGSMADPVWLLLVRDFATRALRVLPERERTVVVLTYWEQLTTRQIGERLGLSQPRVVALHRDAIQRMRRKFLED